MLQQYCPSLTDYRRLQTREVKIGDLLLGNGNPIRIQTMTTTDTMDTEATVAQCVRCIEAGAELVRITAPSKKEAENLLHIKNQLRAMGYTTPLVADIHFTPNAAEIAARIIEKVRVNPGNYVDKKKFDLIDYTDSEYNAEIERIHERFTPLVRICKEYGTAMRIGTNHGSLSDRIMSRYGDTPIGMVESAMEFLRIARGESYHQIILSMKSSNPQVMVQAYRLLIQKMDEEFGECYPLHLGVTEAGDGEDGRIKSAIGIGTLLEDGIGDTIRVSLTEDPEFEIPVCRDIVSRYADRAQHQPVAELTEQEKIQLPYSPFSYKRRETVAVDKIGGHNVPIVVADYKEEETITATSLEAIGYRYDIASDKWNIGDAAADYVYTGNRLLDFALPGTLQVLCDAQAWQGAEDKTKYHPVFQLEEYLNTTDVKGLHFVVIDAHQHWKDIDALVAKTQQNNNLVLCVESTNTHTMPSIRRFMIELMQRGVKCPVVFCVENRNKTLDEQLIDFATNSGGLLLDGFGDGGWLWNHTQHVSNEKITGRTYLEVKNNHQFLNNTAFSILQATRTRISKTEYISCPSCGRTLFDLQETTSKIRNATNHLKGVKIAIMGCIVNGPGEMADADFGYVGSGPGKITLYKGKEVVKRNVPSEIAVNELIELLKENDAWVEPPAVMA
ncbi:(E)-4-hydroxy-3-methylbut-2-enyl-diphosphate synthase [Polluticoccus soli]|uniref:(E)-4-hydroxy-3-methylbut-2-enyl-diphosphate synthase n=1 Tax=Polluticoccus soli TaxID=3034150 RepID=UPI0023E17625|nr:(E)-4-hydroxy-3-methylbut-2-enyl-diphosphate synthase [Flavipsychrobacter sp. JY13-12]